MGCFGMFESNPKGVILQVKDTLNSSKGYLHSFLTLLTSFPTSSKGRSVVTLPPIDDGGMSDRCLRNRC